MASTAVSTVANAVTRITGISGTFALKRWSPSIPSIPGMRRSVDRVEGGAVEGGERLRDGGEVEHGVAPPQHALHHLPRGVEVVHHHEVGLVAHAVPPAAPAASCSSAPAAGRRTRKVAPAPRALSTSTLPPCASAACRTMASPRPVPFAFVV